MVILPTGGSRVSTPAGGDSMAGAEERPGRRHKAGARVRRGYLMPFAEFMAAQASVAAFRGSSFFWITRLSALSKLPQKLSSWVTCGRGKPVLTASANLRVIGSLIVIVVS